MSRLPIPKRALLNVAALTVGSAPSLALPLAAAWRLATDESGILLLCVSIATLLASIVGGGYETASVAAFAPMAARGGHLSPKTLARFIGHAGAVGSVTSCLGFAVLAAIYVLSAGSGFRNELFGGLLLGAAPVVVQAVVWSCASPVGALAIVSKSLPFYYLSAVFRSLPGLIATLLGAPVIVVLALMCTGEVCRFLMLVVVARANGILAPATDGDESLEYPAVPPLGSLASQMSSMTISQFAPVVARTVFVAAGAGYVTSFEIANRLFAVGSQIAMSGIVMPRVAELGAIVISDASMRRSRNDQTIRTVALSATVLAALGAASSIVVALLAGPLHIDHADLGGWWGAIIYLGLPFFAVNGWSTRVLVLARRTRIFPLLGGSYLVATAAVTAIGWHTIGPVAGVLGLTAGTIASAMLAVIASRRAIQLQVDRPGDFREITPT